MTEAKAPEVFSGPTRTKAQIAFGLWWAENKNNCPLNADLAWAIFRSGWWACEDA